MIPDIFHFVYGFRPQTEPFPLLHFLCIRSCVEMNRPQQVMVHCAERPWGTWWDRLDGDVSSSTQLRYLKLRRINTMLASPISTDTLITLTLSALMRLFDTVESTPTSTLSLSAASLTCFAPNRTCRRNMSEIGESETNHPLQCSSAHGLEAVIARQYGFGQSHRFKFSG